MRLGITALLKAGRQTNIVFWGFGRSFVMSAKAKSFVSTYAWPIFALLTATSGHSSASADDHYDFRTFEVRGSRYFSNYEAVVGRYLRQHSPHRRARACVVGQRILGQRNETAYVIWRGGDKLILWWGGGDDDLNRSNRILSLRRDVVASEGSSTYRVSRQWFAMVERNCVRYGRYVTVN
jgi:hypothetical protein